eukprot:CAMPEP_0170097146 /NCGR_PEP_ID=MMETSP0019_2-20121128/29045_1 /TAXON_ID=98059 /ORGANISM="Dinobryon sp., Strain UTEXLB2267" /LENGTH=627 /DNA_ID=CAMNT_0010319347 /DNA_START=8 /DNA_END=1892 /DNA_ORIENTATION=-
MKIFGSRVRSIGSLASKQMRSIDEFGDGANSIDRFLKLDVSHTNDNEKKATLSADSAISSMRMPRQILKAHYSRVYPETSPNPSIVHLSESCASMLNLQLPHQEPNQNDENTQKNLKNKFASFWWAINELVKGLDNPYCMVYGCHCYGQWFGQLGDGRAITLGEVYTEAGEDAGFYSDHLQELQLKGSGRSPYSRGFDGRAVLRSSVREFLASEAMHHLNVPTTRALSLIRTGATVRRPWYRSTTSSNPYSPTDNKNSKKVSQQDTLRRNTNNKFSPDVLLNEPGAVVCRVSRSFLRFGNLELFAKRQEIEELIALADFVCFKEYPHLLAIQKEDSSGTTPSIENLTGFLEHLPAGGPLRYIQLYRAVAESCAKLVSEWLRVGYVQGNMNSDNTLLGGRTLDYGPFGWMEKFDPFYQPFTSDTDGKFSFIRQPTAMSVNFAVLGETAFTALIKATSANSEEAAKYLEELQRIAEKEFSQHFWIHYDSVRRRKLGWKNFSESADGAYWAELEKLMHSSQCDYTIFFRELSTAAGSSSSEEALMTLLKAFPHDFEDMNDINLPESQLKNMEGNLKSAWLEWLQGYAYIDLDGRELEICMVGVAPEIFDQDTGRWSTRRGEEAGTEYRQS